MSKAEDMTYAIERARRQEIFDARVRASTQEHLERYRAMLNDLSQQELAEFIPGEMSQVRSRLADIDRTLVSDPAAARDLSVEIASTVHALPRLARAARKAAQEAAYQAELLRVKAQQSARDELERTWQEHLGSWPDALARQLAYRSLAQVREKLMSPGSTATIGQLQAALSAARDTHESEAQRFRDQTAKAEQALAQQDALESFKVQVSSAEATIPGSAQALAKVLADMRELSPQEFSAQLVQNAQRLDAAVVDETCRREVVQAVHRSLEDAGFVVDRPRRVRTDGTDEVVIRGQRPAGAEAQFRVDLSGAMHYSFERYEGAACKKDIDTVLPRLQSIYGVQLSDRRVCWENPDDIDKEARPRPGMTEESNRGR